MVVAADTGVVVREFSGIGVDEGVSFASFLDSGHAITLDREGLLVIWDVGNGLAIFSKRVAAKCSIESSIAGDCVMLSDTKSVTVWDVVR